MTILSQTSQQRDQARSREDAIWRSTIEEFKSATQHNVPLGGLLAQVKLKPFFKSPVYGDQANQLARLVLPRIGDPDAFKDLFESVKWNNLNEMVAVNRSLSNLYDEVSDELKKQPPPSPAPRATSGNPATSGPGLQRGNVGQLQVSHESPTFQEQLEHSQLTIEQQESYVCDQIADAARSGKLTWDKSPNLESAWFSTCDLSGLNLANAILTNASFHKVNIQDARLGNISKIDGLYVADVSWWRAKEIGPNLLKHLMDCCDPGAKLEGDLPTETTKEEYVKRVKELCRGAGLDCPDASIKFTTAPSPAK